MSGNNHLKLKYQTTCREFFNSNCPPWPQITTHNSQKVRNCWLVGLSLAGAVRSLQTGDNGELRGDRLSKSGLARVSLKTGPRCRHSEKLEPAWPQQSRARQQPSHIGAVHSTAQYRKAAVHYTAAPANTAQSCNDSSVGFNMKTY